MNAPADAPTRPSPAVGTPIVFRRAAAAEWRRLWTVRSTSWSLIATTALFAVVFVTFLSEPPDHEFDGLIPVTAASRLAIAMGEYGLLLIAMLAVTSEFSTGAIRTSLQWLPRRSVLFAARTAVTVSFVTITAIALVLTTDVAVWIATGSDPRIAPLTVHQLLTNAWTGGVVMASSALLTVGLGFLLRHSAGTLTAVFLLLFVLPASVADVPVDALRTVGAHLPGSAVVSLLDIASIVGDQRAVAILAGWSIAALAAGATALVRRDV